MRVLLLSAYHAKSHQYWCDGLVSQFPEHVWTVLTLPARYFSWRVRGNGLTWSIQEAKRLQCNYDLVLATSMTDLATLRGLVPSLAVPKNIVYFHENQFAYPPSSAQYKSVEPQMASIFSALAADQIYFNSHYNRTTFLTGVEALLRRLPDCVPAGVTEMLRSKSEVLAVPIHCANKPITNATIMAKASSRTELQVLHVVWNHRWEYDKGGELLLEAIGLLPQGCAIQFSILGQSFRKVPEVFARIKALLVKRQWLGHWGYIEDTAHYQSLLSSAHVVLSTALHDFQGLAVLQAVNAGCIPLVPDRLAYKELFAKEYRYGGGQCESQTLALELAKHASQLQQSGVALAPDVSQLCWHSLRSVYQAKFAL